VVSLINNNTMTYAIETLEKELYLINRCLSDNPEVRLKQFERIKRFSKTQLKY